MKLVKLHIKTSKITQKNMHQRLRTLNPVRENLDSKFGLFGCDYALTLPNHGTPSFDFGIVGKPLIRRCASSLFHHFCIHEWSKFCKINFHR
jgi:hypothetical protein